MHIVTDEQKRQFILEYEEVLIGKRKQFSSYYFSKNAKRDSDIALEAFRYVFNDILNWEAKIIENNLTFEFLKKYKLDKYYSNYIIFENEPNKKPRFVMVGYDKNGEVTTEKKDIVSTEKQLLKADVQQLLKMIYGDKYVIDRRNEVIETYNNVINGQAKKFPKHFFDAIGNGREKACICLQYAINNQNTFRSIEELYSVFADRNILKLLEQWRLKDVAATYYDHPLDFLHDALSDEDKDEDFFEYYYEEYKKVLEESGREF